MTITDDPIPEADETIILTMTAGADYIVGTLSVHTVTIVDDDGAPSTPTTPATPSTPEARFAAAASNPFENAGTHTVRVTVSPAPTSALTLTYTVGGTATAGTDYTALSESVTVEAQTTSVDIPVEITDDNLAESNKTLTLALTLITDAGYTLGAPSVHTLTIQDDDTAGLAPSQTTLHLEGTGAPSPSG